MTLLRSVPSLLVLAVMMGGCGGAGAAQTSARLAPHAARDPLAGTFVDAQDHVVPRSEVLARLAAARVVYVGEAHGDAASHALQLAVLRAQHAQQPSLAIGLEMVQRPYQAALDAYVAGRGDEVELLAGTEWAERWGFDFALYRGLFKFARSRHLPIRALNARAELTRRIGREGLAALSDAERAELPETDASDAAHRAMVMAMLGDHPGLDDAMRDRFYAAQLVWDETMAEEVARTLSAPGAPRQMIVFAGLAHIRGGLGIPKRAARRGAAPFVTVLPAAVCESPGDADLRWRP